MAVPLELEGKLDESKEWEVEVSSFFFVFVVWLSFFFFFVWLILDRRTELRSIICRPLSMSAPAVSRSRKERLVHDAACVHGAQTSRCARKCTGKIDDAIAS